MSKFAITNDRHVVMRAAGMEPFQSCWNSNTNDQAERMMARRCFFYTADTMRYFGCRVAWVDIKFDGLLMVSVFSQHADYKGTAREWRFQVHDCSGHSLTDSTANGHRTREQAEKALAAFLTTVKPGAVLKEMVARKRHELNTTRAALAKI